MAKYYLKQNKRNSNEYIDFSKIEKFKALDSTKLKNIDNFTSIFKNEEELKFYLCQEGLIDLDSINNNLKIVYKYKKQDKKVPYGLVFEEDMKLFNERMIKQILNDNIYDFDLLEKLCNRFKEYYGQDVNIHVIRNHVALFRNENMQYSLPNSEKEQLISMYRNAINRFVHGIVTKYDSKKQKETENYRGLRDLAMFLSYQSKKQINEFMNEECSIIEEKSNMIEEIDFIKQHRIENEEFLTSEDYKNIPDYDSLHGTISEENSDDKRKVKNKNIHIPGQLSFKDMGW